VPRTSRADRKEAARRAAIEWLSRYPSQSQAAKAAQDRGVGLKQPLLGQYIHGRKIGEGTVDLFAELFGVSADGLVRLFLRAEGAMALRDVQGWKKAKAEAQSDPGIAVDPWVWHAIDDVAMPCALRKADKQMVKELAQFLNYWGQTSGVRDLKAAGRK
jgi:hypothetical protein